MLNKFRKTPLKRTFFKKTPKKKSNAEVDKMREFFMSIWKKRHHYCFICGVSLGTEPRSYHFHHVIGKRHQCDYNVDISYDENNIILVCLDCHTNVENGYEPLSVKSMKSKLLDSYSEHKIM